MSAAPVIRDALAGDVPALADAASRFFLATYEHLSDPDDIAAHVAEHFGTETIAAEFERAEVRYLVAIGDGDIVGFIKLRRGDNPDALADRDAIEVQQLYVSPDCQRGGIGRRLMDRAVAIAADEGADGIWLSVWEDAHWATRFYEGYGMRPLGELEFRVGKTSYVDLLMWLPLKPGD